MKERFAVVNRKTNETDICVRINLDGTGKFDIHTGIAFLDHMLEGFCRHGIFDLDIKCSGDLQIDSHHTVEDMGIVLGEAIFKSLGDKAGIRRYGHIVLPMDDALILCAVDLSGRPYFVSDITYSVNRLGALETEMLHEFFYALVYSAKINLHFKKLAGFNNHHIAEATFKSFAKALDMAIASEERLDGVLSTKGLL